MYDNTLSCESLSSSDTRTAVGMGTAVGMVTAVVGMGTAVAHFEARLLGQPDAGIGLLVQPDAGIGLLVQPDAGIGLLGKPHNSQTCKQ